MKKIYMVGICGTGMGNLALMLKETGYSVTGSDQGIYPPMSTQLEKAGINILQGYDIQNIKKKPDIAIIGNVIRRDNPEAQYIMENDIEYYSLPEALRKFFFEDKKSVVISGTHGKTTTSFMMAWLLENSGKKPGFFIGGIPKDFEVMGRTAKGEYFVIEGDEYDTAFFDKVPKFFHYKPEFLIINAIEFDHADIYKDLDSIKAVFKKLIEMVPEHGAIAYNSDDPDICELITSAGCRTISFGIRTNAVFNAGNIKVVHSDNLNISEPRMEFDVIYKGKTETYDLRIPGKHNVMNALGVIAISDELGLSCEQVKHALSSFRGVKRRQDVYGISGDRIIIDDFAHHSTAVSYVIEAIREWYYPRRVWAVFEPRTATTRTNTMQKEMTEALKKAEKVLIAPVDKPERVPEAERFNPEEVCKELQDCGIDATHFFDVASIVEYLGFNTSPGDVILIMSNGGFDNIYKKLMKVFNYEQQ